jgi:hypothetical protein
MSRLFVGSILGMTMLMSYVGQRAHADGEPQSPLRAHQGAAKSNRIKPNDGSTHIASHYIRARFGI